MSDQTHARSSSRGRTRQHGTAEPEALQLESALDDVLAELSRVYSSVSMQIARIETANGETKNGIRLLKDLIRQAEAATEALQEQAEQKSANEDSSVLRKPASGRPQAGQQEDEVLQEENDIPAIANIDSVLAQARAIRISAPAQPEKPGARVPPRGAPDRSRRSNPPQQAPPWRVDRQAPPSKARAGARQEAVSSREVPGGSSSGALRRGVGGAPAGPSGSTRPSHQPQPSRAREEEQGAPPQQQHQQRQQEQPQPHQPPREPPPMPSAPSLPQRVGASLRRLEAAQQERRDSAGSGASLDDGSEFWTGRIRASGQGFLDALDRAQESGAAPSVPKGPHRDEWISFRSQRCLELLALNLAQRWLSGAVEHIVELLSPEPREHHDEQGGAAGDPESLAKEVERVWGEVKDGLARATAAGTFPSEAEVTAWRNAAVKAVLDGGNNDPSQRDEEEACGAGEAFIPPVDAWLPPDLWALLPPSNNEHLGGAAARPPWMEPLFPGLSFSPAAGSQGEVMCESWGQLDGVLRARHQLQLCLLQLHLEGGAAAAALLPPPGAAPAPGSRGREHLAARIRLADGFLVRGLDRGLCTLSDKFESEGPYG